MEIFAFVVGCVVTVFFFTVLVPFYSKTKQDRIDKEKNDLDDFVEARRYMVASLNHAIVNGDLITPKYVKSCIEQTNHYHPTVNIDFDLMADSFIIYIELGKHKSKIDGYCFPPIEYITKNLHYTIV